MMMANDQNNANSSSSSSNIYVPSSSSVSSSLSSSSLTRAQLDDVAYDFGMIMMDLKNVCTTLSMLARQIDQVVQRVDNKFGYIIENINNFNLETNGTLAEENNNSFNPRNMKLNKTNHHNSNYAKNGAGANLVLNHVTSEPLYQSVTQSTDVNRQAKNQQQAQNGRKVNNEIILTNLTQKAASQQQSTNSGAQDPNSILTMNGTRVIRTSSERKSTFGASNNPLSTQPAAKNLNYEAVNANLTIETNGGAHQPKAAAPQNVNVVPINHARLDRYDIWTSSSYLPQGSGGPNDSNSQNSANERYAGEVRNNSTSGEYSQVNPTGRQHNFTKIKCTRSKSQPAFKDSALTQSTIPTSESQKISAIVSSSPLNNNNTNNTNYSPNVVNSNGANIGTSGASMTLLSESGTLAESSFYEDQLDNELESFSNSSSINNTSAASVQSNGGQNGNARIFSSSKLQASTAVTAKAQEDLKEIINSINTMAMSSAVVNNGAGNNNNNNVVNSESLRPATTNLKGSKAKSGNGNHHVSFNINNAIYTSRQETPIPISILKPAAVNPSMSNSHHGNMSNPNGMSQQKLIAADNANKQQQQQHLHLIQQQQHLNANTAHKSTPNKSFTTVINNTGNNNHMQPEVEVNYYANESAAKSAQNINSLTTSSNLANSLSSMSSSSSSSASSPLQSSTIKKSPGINASLNQFNSDRADPRNGISNGGPKAVRLDSKTTVL